MKVLQLISSEGHYGAENMLLQLSRSLQTLGCEGVAGVFENSHRPHLEVAERARDQGIPVEIIPCRGRLDWRAVRRIRECVKKRKIDLIHAHGYKSNLYGYAAARPFGLPLVATCHNWPGKTISLRMYYRLDHFILRRFDRIAAVSNLVVKSLREAGIPPNKIRVVENGIDVSCFANSGPHKKDVTDSQLVRIGAVGRLAPEKGLSFLLLAAREILHTHPSTEFLIVGDGPGRPRLECQVRELGIEKRVVFAGTRNDMPAVYSSLDIFVLPSLNEGMPLALLEAMAAGKPVVATDVGSIPNVVVSGSTGLLVEAANVAQLRSSIERLIDNPLLRQSLGSAGQRFVAQRFSAEAMASIYLSIYEELTDQRVVA